MKEIYITYPAVVIAGSLIAFVALIGVAFIVWATIQTRRWERQNRVRSNTGL